MCDILQAIAEAEKLAEKGGDTTAPVTKALGLTLTNVIGKGTPGQAVEQLGQALGSELARRLIAADRSKVLNRFCNRQVNPGLG